jgi:hypothetical protein
VRPQTDTGCSVAVTNRRATQEMLLDPRQPATRLGLASPSSAAQFSRPGTGPRNAGARQPRGKAAQHIGRCVNTPLAHHHRASVAPAADRCLHMAAHSCRAGQATWQQQMLDGTRPWTNEQHRGVRRPSSRGAPLSAQQNQRRQQQAPGGGIPRPDEMLRVSVETQRTQQQQQAAAAGGERHRARMGLPGFNLQPPGAAADGEQPQQPDLADLAKGWPVAAAAHGVELQGTPERRPAAADAPFSPTTRAEANQVRLQDFQALQARMDSNDGGGGGAPPPTQQQQQQADTRTGGKENAGGGGESPAARHSGQQQQQPSSSKKKKSSAPKPSSKRGGCSEAWLRMSADAAHAPWSTITGEEGGPDAASDPAAAAAAAAAVGDDAMVSKQRGAASSGWRLRQAVMEDNIRDAMTLLAKGAEPNVKCGAGCTPLLLAAYMGHKDCLAVLLDAGAAVDASNALGDTALMLASGRGHGDCCEKLLCARADPNRENRQGNTALHRAALWGQQSVARLLLNYGAHSGIRNHANVKPAGMTGKYAPHSSLLTPHSSLLTPHSSSHIIS